MVQAYGNLQTTGHQTALDEVVLQEALGQEQVLNLKHKLSHVA